ncbi:MAG: ABC transporter permease [Anaerolineae bacterium]
MTAVTQEATVANGGLSTRRARFYGLFFLLAALLIALIFARGAQPGQLTRFVLNPSGETQALPVPDLVFGTQPVLYVLAVLTAFLGGWQLARGFRRANLLLSIVALLFVLAFLIWAARDNTLNMTVLLSSTLLRATPIALAALSGVLCERSAVINIAIEGMMLVGAFMAAIIASLGRSVWLLPDWASVSLGLAAALIGGGLMGLLLAVLAVRFKVDQIVAGTAINIFATGITSFLSSRILEEFEFLNSTPVLGRTSIPLLSKIPVIGPILFEQNLLGYVLFLLIAAIHIMLFYTRWGLRTRAVGEHPKAADTLGIDVYRIRYINVILGGMVAGLAGAFLVIGSVGRFDELMTAGKGFIGLAAMIFGKWMPVGAFGAALIFGFADTLQTRLAILSVPIPSQFLLMAPYLVTMIVLAGVVGRANPPAADGQPYEKE